jgi:hypothetical protein
LKGSGPRVIEVLSQYFTGRNEEEEEETLEISFSG